MQSRNEILTENSFQGNLCSGLHLTSPAPGALLGLNESYFLIQPKLLLTPVCAKLPSQSFEHRTIHLIQGESICIQSPLISKCNSNKYKCKYKNKIKFAFNLPLSRNVIPTTAFLCHLIGYFS